MFGPEYFTVAAYFDGECTIVCRECGEKKNLPTGESLSEAQVNESFYEDGLYCEDCGKEIVEPPEPEEESEETEAE